MGHRTISVTYETYKALKAEKRKGESFSNLILRKFGKGNPSALLAYLSKRQPNMELADSVERASEELRGNLRLRKAEL